MTPLLDVQNISKAFGAHVLFENISFSIAEGQHVGLIAKNGTGKSTLLSLLSGKESVDSGSIIFRRDIKVADDIVNSDFFISILYMFLFMSCVFIIRSA